MSIFEDARKGLLVGDKLNSWLKHDASVLDAFEDSTGWTLLATAVVSGFPRQVDQLLHKGADVNRPCKNGETPLLLAAWKTKIERPLIVQKLLSRKPLSVDATCSLAANKTPLMYAIENGDIETVRLLRKAGANNSIKNDEGFNAKEVARNIGNKAVIRALDPAKEQFDLARVAAAVVTFLSNVVSKVNHFLKGIITWVFGKEKPDRKPNEPTAKEFVKNVDTYVQDNPVLKVFFGKKKSFIHDIAQKSVDLAKDSSTDLGCPDLLPKTTQVTMHQQVIYCDDSGSMINEKGKREKRWEGQQELVRRIAAITTRILPDGEGVALRFINQDVDNSSNLDLQGIEANLKSIDPKGNTKIGTGLETKILNPLVYNKLATGKFERPLLITIITDGDPSDEDESKLADTIVDCGDRLSRNGFPPESVKFLIGQVGSAKNAERFLDRLTGNDAIAKVAHIFAGRLDDKFKQFRDERGLDRWLIETLFEPLRAAETKKNQ